jgi:hypothetical protein
MRTCCGEIELLLHEANKGLEEYNVFPFALFWRSRGGDMSTFWALKLGSKKLLLSMTDMELL